MTPYLALVTRAGDGTDLVLRFPDVPGVEARGRDAAQVLESAGERLSRHLATLQAEGASLPRASALQELLGDPAIRKQAEPLWTLVVPRPVHAPRVRINIMIDPGILKRADEAAGIQGVSRSAYIEEAVRISLPDGAETGRFRR